MLNIFSIFVYPFPSIHHRVEAHHKSGLLRMKQIFIEKGVVVAEIDSQSSRTKGDLIEDLPISYKMKISEISYHSDTLLIECRKYPQGFKLNRIS
ncbi:hypothetical protein EDB67_10497 [Vibrio crassostreae]|nr:hypothetical protein EDB67_10497 [Vibrio crassostreae]